MTNQISSASLKLFVLFNVGRLGDYCRRTWTTIVRLIIIRRLQRKRRISCRHEADDSLQQPSVLLSSEGKSIHMLLFGFDTLPWCSQR